IVEHGHDDAAMRRTPAVEQFWTSIERDDGALFRLLGETDAEIFDEGNTETGKWQLIHASDDGTSRRVLSMPRRRQRGVHHAGETSFRPIMPATMSPMQPRRASVAGSLKRMMPSMAVPTAPIPVQIA